MALDRLTKIAAQLLAVTDLTQKLTGSKSAPVLSGWAGSGKAWVLAGIFEQLKRPMLIITSSELEAEQTQEDLESFLGSSKVRLFPNWDTNFLAAEAPEAEIVAERLETLTHLQSGETGVVTLSASALLEPTLGKEYLKQSCIELSVGEANDLGRLVKKLENLGFKRNAWVEEVGDYSLRGGILDVFAYSFDSPVRIEFFGNQVESIRTFSVLSQRSTTRLGSVAILPLREFQASLEQINQDLEKLKPHARGILEASDYYQSDHPGWEWLTFLLGFQKSTILDFLPDEAIVVLDEPDLIKDKLDEILAGWKSTLSQKGLEEFSPEIEKLHSSVKSKLNNFQQVKWESLPKLSDNEAKTVINLGLQELPVIAGNFKLLEKTLEEYLSQNYSVYLVCDSHKQKERLQEILENWGDRIYWEVGTLNAGFVHPEIKLAVLADHQLFGRPSYRFKPRKFKEGLAISSYKSLNPQDYVVHIDYGIGRFKGLTTLNLDGVKRECLEITYAGDDKLYVPIEEFRLVQKFIGKEGEPVLSKLGGTSWEKAKQRVKKVIVEMAEELLQLYAERQAKAGLAFSLDGLWQKELEASFPYQETPDQLKAIEEVKRDMHLAHPMDRLVCGDVGYGKTEVALRAAFKAVCDHKQVAVLVPTTILAFQHLNTFSERLKDFPVKVEMLSRFRNRSEQKKILQELASGQIDIVIGTHMLLQERVKFRDLGLLIIDEEHRFGVAQKEKIKKYKRLIDVLTLTATPIPRTMQMALFGARDMSAINTPPAGRQSIHTEIVRFSPKTIAESILREISRGGQVFFVHNRIQTIEGVHRFLNELLPEIKIAVAHGQMPEQRLEKIVLDFMDRKYDLLLSTTIIESGLDLRNVNTIIINRADKFGLAELYQLRGRVGRSEQKAYAYLLVPPDSSLQEAARKRLKALEQFSELGSGFHLALKDLEIRGAGNLLGPQQHGYIAEVGIDLYFRLLEQTVSELKGGESKPEVHAKIETNLEAHLPGDYISDSRQRIEIYTRLSEAENLDEVEAVESELEDRFGVIPEPVGNLLQISRLRILAQSRMIEKLSLSDNKVSWEYSPQVFWNKEKLLRLAGKIEKKVEFSGQEKLKVVVTTIAEEKFNLEWVKKLLPSL